MISEQDFWDTEGDAPLLRRNAGHMLNENEDVSKVLERAKTWLDIAYDTHRKSINNVNVDKDEEDQVVIFQSESTIDLDDSTSNEAINRIFSIDAERTFSNPTNRKKMTKILNTVYNRINDYHQGLGFVVAFLMLQLSPEDTVRMVLLLHECYLQGYFKTAPFKYVRDAKVFEKLLKEKYPDVSEKIANVACAEAFCSKWFVGLNVHVLPYKSLCRFFELLLTYGNVYLFKYALSVCKNCSQDILNAKDASDILAILRLDNNIYHDKKSLFEKDEEDEGSFFMNIVEDALNIDVSTNHIIELQKQVEEEMYLAAEKRKEADKLLDFDDDEIVFSDEE